jgi:ubiquinone biosynthesis protein
MTNWDFLIGQTALAEVLPGEYAHFCRPIAGALAVFLESLPKADQAAILADQLALPPAAGAAERLGVLARNCPSLHKLAQVLARDRRISLELRKHFQELESLPPAVPFETIESTLAQELGPLDRLGVKLAPQALAEASIAVVAGFHDERGGRDGVFKVLKPGIEERFERELALLDRVGSYLDQRCDDFRIPHLDYREVFEQVQEKLRHEIRLDLEQQNLVQARAFFASEPRVLVPERFEYCTRRVTAMERVWGGKVTDHALELGSEKSRLARLVSQALIARPIFTKTGPALFHGDPHAGNLFLAIDGRLAILDWSLVGSLDDRERVGLVQLILGALTLDAERIGRLLAGLSERQRIDRAALRTTVRAWVERIRRGQLPSFTWLMGLLDDAVKTSGLRLGADLLLFRKTINSLEGVITDVDGQGIGLDDVLLGEFVCQFVREWPARWLAPPCSRDFATRLSNADLAGLLLSAPSAIARFWLPEPVPVTASGDWCDQAV